MVDHARFDVDLLRDVDAGSLRRPGTTKLVGRAALGGKMKFRNLSEMSRVDAEAVLTRAVRTRFLRRGVTSAFAAVAPKVGRTGRRRPGDAFRA